MFILSLFLFSTLFIILFAKRLAISKKFSIYFIINNFFKMFVEKIKRTNSYIIQKNTFSLIVFQTRIIFYFLPVTFKKSKKLNSIKQSSFVAKKLIDVERFDLKRVFSFFRFFLNISHSWLLFMNFLSLKYLTKTLCLLV